MENDKVVTTGSSKGKHKLDFCDSIIILSPYEKVSGGKNTFMCISTPQVYASGVTVSTFFRFFQPIPQQTTNMATTDPAVR